MLARSMVFTAHPGSSDALADVLLRVAGSLQEVPGCLQWIVARNPAAEDEVWVQELWASAADAEAAIAAESDGDTPTPADVMALCAAPPRRTDLTPLGGVGYA